MIFVDTGAWYASLVPDEPHHHQVTAWLSANTESLLTTDYCLAETLNLFVARNRPRLAVSFGKSLLEGKIGSLHFLTEPQIAKAFILFETRCHAGWSFTDCTSKAVLADLNIKSALALDHHFQQFGITIVP